MKNGLKSLAILAALSLAGCGAEQYVDRTPQAPDMPMPGPVAATCDAYPIVAAIPMSGTLVNGRVVASRFSLTAMRAQLDGITVLLAPDSRNGRVTGAELRMVRTGAAVPAEIKIGEPNPEGHGILGVEIRLLQPLALADLERVELELVVDATGFVPKDSLWSLVNSDLRWREAGASSGCTGAGLLLWKSQSLTY